MEYYHQRYSDIDDMSLKDVLFFLRLYEARKKYEEQQMKKAQQKGRR